VQSQEEIASNIRQLCGLQQGYDDFGHFGLAEEYLDLKHLRFKHTTGDHRQASCGGISHVQMSGLGMDAIGDRQHYTRTFITPCFVRPSLDMLSIYLFAGNCQPCHRLM
jgi:hypothetical protein